LYDWGPALPSLSAFTKNPPKPGHCPQISSAFASHHMAAAGLSGSVLTFEKTCSDQHDNVYVMPLPRFKLGGHPVLSVDLNVEAAGSERKNGRKVAVFALIGHGACTFGAA
jgi:hypothetical protein